MSTENVPLAEASEETPVAEEVTASTEVADLPQGSPAASPDAASPAAGAPPVAAATAAAAVGRDASDGGETATSDERTPPKQPEPVAGQSFTAHSPTAIRETSGQPAPDEAEAEEQPVRTIRRGSPFAEPGTQPPPSVLPTPAPAHVAAALPVYPRNAASVGGALASVFLGLLSLLGCFFAAPAALVTGLIGVGMGVWGLYSTRRGLAMLGVLLCCLAISVGGFFSAVELYTQMYGEDPFAIDPTTLPEAPAELE